MHPAEHPETEQSSAQAHIMTSPGTLSHGLAPVTTESKRTCGRILTDLIDILQQDGSIPQPPKEAFFGLTAEEQSSCWVQPATVHLHHWLCVVRRAGVNEGCHVIFFQPWLAIKHYWAPAPTRPPIISDVGAEVISHPGRL
jgi:hypothetical protein